MLRSEILSGSDRNKLNGELDKFLATIQVSKELVSVTQSSAADNKVDTTVLDIVIIYKDHN